MSGIVVAAIVTAAVAVAGYGYLIHRLSRPEERTALLVAAIVMLPMQPLVFHFVRLPADGVVRAVLGEGWLYAFAATFYAPLTEEPAKWLVLLAPPVARALTPRAAVPIALATGLGFGLGEIGLIAEQVTRVPALAALPAWQFGGFFVERLLVCFAHGVMVLMAFRWLAEGRGFWPGALLGMVVHYLLNLPIYVAGLDILPIAPEFWQAGIQLYLVAFTIGGGLLVNRLVAGPRPPRAKA